VFCVLTKGESGDKRTKKALLVGAFGLLLALGAAHAQTIVRIAPPRPGLGVSAELQTRILEKLGSMYLLPTRSRPATESRAAEVRIGKRSA